MSLGLATDRFRVVTSEGARRLEVARVPRSLPTVPMVDHLGRRFDWNDFDGRGVLVEFIFTTCPDVCQRMSSDFGALVRAEQLAADRSGLQGDHSVRFVSLTFDPDNDTLERLRSVAEQFGADGERWRFARIADSKDLAETLDAFGIVAIRSPIRGFEHNAAIHGLNRRGQLARIADITETDEMLRWARFQSN